MSKYLSGSGKYLTRQLFYEQWIDIVSNDRVFDKPPFSLHRDREGMINFGQAYVNSRDPTGYKVSQELLGSYNHWTALQSCRWFVAAKEIWDKEMDAMFKSEALEEIGTLMKDGMPAQKLAAAKYLANAEHRKDRMASKGRPRREDIDRAARDLAANEKDVLDDLKRIRNIKEA